MISKLLGIRKKREVRQTLMVLYENSQDEVSIETLAEQTGLGKRIYPILANLHRDGYAAGSWQNETGGQKLSYHLTTRGLEEARKLLEGTTQVEKQKEPIPSGRATRW